MDSVVSFGLSEDLVAGVAGLIEREWLAAGRELHRLAIVFGGRRPHLFLRRELARRLGAPFRPPAALSMDDFVERLAREREPEVSFIPELEACHLLHGIARRLGGSRWIGRETFPRFLPWAREILRFIENLDLEAVGEDPLRGVSLAAAVGYDVPADVNELLRHVVAIRAAFHGALRSGGRTTRGLAYLAAAQADHRHAVEEWDRVLFCGFFYLHRTERTLVGRLLDAGTATLCLQGEGDEWPVLRELLRGIGRSAPPPPAGPPPRLPALTLGPASDAHTQAAMVRERVERLGDPDGTVIVVPEAGNLIPLLTAVAPAAGDFNVSLGYPLSRSSLASLVKAIFAAQRSRRGDAWYARDYLAVLRHPLVKNLRLPFWPAEARAFVNALDAALSGDTPSPLAGRAFVRTTEIEAEGTLLAAVGENAGGDAPTPSAADAVGAIGGIPDLLLGSWRKVASLAGLAASLRRLMETLLAHSTLAAHPPNLAALERFHAICDEFEAVPFADEPLAATDAFSVCEEAIASGVVSFAGSPLRGLQVLGIMETRALTFRHVIVVDAVESVLPAVHVTEPLIPREVMVAIGIRRLEREEEIQRYHLMRLAAGAETVDLFYEENAEHERSRFVEELVWRRELAAGRTGVVPERRGRFRVRAGRTGRIVEKTPEVLASLASFVFSPTSLDSYLACPLQFCLRHLFGLRERPDMLGDADGSDIGTFVHDLLKDAFSPFLGRRPVVDEGFRNDMARMLAGRFRSGFEHRGRGDAFLTRVMLERAVGRLLDAEAVRPVARILSIEQGVSGTAVSASGKPCACAARVDRIDLMEDGSRLIIDYKTGSPPGSPSRRILGAAPADRRQTARLVGSFQLPLSLHLLPDAGPAPAAAAYYAVRDADLKQLFTGRGWRPEDAGPALAACMAALARLLDEIADPSTSFAADPLDERTCGFCPFARFCS